jgi:hypothetical protein
LEQISDMEEASWSRMLRTLKCMKDGGEKIKKNIKAVLFGKVEMCTSANIIMIYLMEKGTTHGQMEDLIKDNGRTVAGLDLEQSSIVMATSTLANG